MQKHLLLLILLVSQALITNAQPSSEEYQALIALYNATNGASWTNNTGWKDADPNTVQSVQGWYGVSTDTQGHVIYLNLSANNLIGSIPSDIGNLTYLQILLDLHYNHLSGNIPVALGNLVSLKKLQLENNQLSGVIPSSLGNLRSLEEVSFHANQLSGSIPAEFGNLTNLKFLQLSHNQLSGVIPSSLGNLTNLWNLQLHGNALSGSIPSSIGNLTALIYLTLHYNQLSGAIPAELGNLVNLKGLYMQNNQLSGPIPSTFGNLKSVEEMILGVNKLSAIPAELGNMTKLKSLELYDNQLSGTIPNTFGNLANIEKILIYQNQLSGDIPAELGNLHALKVFELWNNKLSGVFPQGLSNVQTLRFDVNRFTFSGFIGLKQIFSGTSFTYSNQGLIDEEKTVKASVGASLTLTTSIDRNTNPASVYQWFKVVNGTSTALNTASTAGHTHVIENMTAADAGTKYYYKITNTAAPGLTLTSHPQTFQVLTCTAPALDFQFEETEGTHAFTPALSQADGCTFSYSWDFGDGATSAEASPRHAYTAAGTYAVKLAVSYTCGECPASQILKEYTVTVENKLCGSIFCDDNGGVGIGTRKTEGFRLSVNGKIRASDIIKVYPQTQWSDFVFDADYKLRPLK